MPPIVSIRHLRKEYRETVAVCDLSLDLEAGDIFGFIGPNGAGKTTTIKILATLLSPSAGAATVNGIDVVENPEGVRAVVGYMPDFFGVYDDVKVWEYLDFFAAAYRIPRPRRPHVIDDVLALTDLTGKKDSYVESLSRGMKQRLCLAKTLVHDPRLLLLDEPASGLDPRARIEFKELMKELQAMGKTILVSSHILPELADFCNKVGIIERGELKESGHVGEVIRRATGRRMLEIRVVVDGAPGGVPDGAETGPAAGTDAASASPMAQRAADVLASRSDIDEVKTSDGVLLAAFTGEPDEEWLVLNALVGAGVRVVHFGAQAADLEDVFMHVTKGLVA